jgi:hypothetical protein
MACKRCDSDNQSTFNGEIAIHFPGLEGLEKPIVLGKGPPTVVTVSVDAYFLEVPNSASKSANSGRC